jgi:hypothetical protein
MPHFNAALKQNSPMKKTAFAIAWIVVKKLILSD